MRQQLFMASALAGLALACDIPTAPPPRTILDPFMIQFRNESYPGGAGVGVHNHFMYVFESGGGDQHIFMDEPGTFADNLYLEDGVLYYPGPPHPVHACINREYNPADGTTKMFMTERDEPLAIFAPTYQCHPDTDELEIILVLELRATDPPEIGGYIGARKAFRGGGNASFDTRWSPEGNTLYNPNDPWINMTMAIVFTDPENPLPSGTTTSSTTSSTSTSSTTSTTSTTSSETSTTSTTSTTSSTSSTSTTSSTSSTSTTSSTTSSTSTSSTTSTTFTPSPLPYADLTSINFAFRGCAPEERTANDFIGRTLPHLYADDSMTNEMCASYCLANGYHFAGTEYARECWCGNTVVDTRWPGDTIESLAGCRMGCAGAPGEKCGGPDWLSLYEVCGEGGCDNSVFT